MAWYDDAMLVFIDDSGDPGFKTTRGSSEQFVIALVIFDDELEAERTGLAIKDLRREIFGNDYREFHFSELKRGFREKFLQTVAPFVFRIRCIVMKKAQIYSPNLRTKKAAFYNYAIKMALQHSGLQDAKIRLDRSGDRLFRQRLMTYLRRELNNERGRIISDCKLLDSKTSPLIQLADMVAGSIRRSYDTSKTDAAVYRAIIRRHIEDEWKFG